MHATRRTGTAAAALVLGTLAAGVAAGLEPRRPSDLVQVAAAGGECACHPGSVPLNQVTGIDGLGAPLALGDGDAIVLTGGTINVFSAPAGAEHLVSVLLFTAGCGGGTSVAQRVAVASADGTSVTDFDFDLGLAINAEALLCVRASIGATPLDAQARFRGFRAKNR